MVCCRPGSLNIIIMNGMLTIISERRSFRRYRTSPSTRKTCVVSTVTRYTTKDRWAEFFNSDRIIDIIEHFNNRFVFLGSKELTFRFVSVFSNPQHLFMFSEISVARERLLYNFAKLQTEITTLWSFIVHPFCN